MCRDLERTALWIERVGLDSIKKALVDDSENRRELNARFLFSQAFSQDDPWAERAAKGVDRHEFKLLAEVG